MSLFLTRRAKAEKTTLSQVFIKMTEDAKLYAEEGHIWEEALRRKKTSNGKYIPMSEIWTPEHGLRNPL